MIKIDFIYSNNIQFLQNNFALFCKFNADFDCFTQKFKNRNTFFDGFLQGF